MGAYPQCPTQTVWASARYRSAENCFGVSCALGKQEVVEFLSSLDWVCVHRSGREGASYKSEREIFNNF